MITAHLTYWNEAETTMAWLTKEAWILACGHKDEDGQSILERLEASRHIGFDRALVDRSFYEIAGEDFKFVANKWGHVVERFFINPKRILRIEPTREGGLYRIKFPHDSVTITAHGAEVLMRSRFTDGLRFYRFD